MLFQKADDVAANGIALRSQGREVSGIRNNQEFGTGNGTGSSLGHGLGKETVQGAVDDEGGCADVRQLERGEGFDLEEVVGGAGFAR